VVQTDGTLIFIGTAANIQYLFRHRVYRQSGAGLGTLMRTTRRTLARSSVVYLQILFMSSCVWLGFVGDGVQ
jgi:hypothetical protein